jgi:hypothetical protein
MNFIELHNEFIEPDFKYNLFSVCVFRLKDKYKESYMYYNGLGVIINNFEKIFPNDYYLRIYYDTSVLDNNDPEMIEDTNKIWKPLFNIAKQKKRVQLVKYNIPKYRINKTYHDGLIGTFIRFIPFFDLKENKNIGTVITSDIDLSIHSFKMNLEILNVFNKIDVPFFYKTDVCYEMGERFKILSSEFNIESPINAGKIFTKIKFPTKIFNNFFKCITNSENNKCKYMQIFYDKYSTFLNLYKKVDSHDELLKKDKVGKFPYGIDELFLMYLKDEYLIKKKIKYAIYLNNVIFKFMYIIYLKYKNDLLDNNVFKKFLKLIMNKLYINSDSLDKNYEEFDKIIWKGTSTQKNKYNYIKSNFKNGINYIINNNLYRNIGFENKNDFKCILQFNTYEDHTIHYRNL